MVYSTIYEPINLCKFHHVVLLKTEPFYDDQKEYKQVYAIDFSPVDDITDWKIALQLLFGKSVKGKIQLTYFDIIQENEFDNFCFHQKKWLPLETLQHKDMEMYDKIMSWNPIFHLYKHNCQNFGRYLMIL